MIANKRFTPSSVSEEIVNAVRADNDSVLLWIDDASLDRSWFEGTPVREAFTEYCSWCEESALRNFSINNFSKKVTTRFGFKSESRKLDYATGRKSVKVFCD